MCFFLQEDYRLKKKENERVSIDLKIDHIVIN